LRRIIMLVASSIVVDSSVALFCSSSVSASMKLRFQAGSVSWRMFSNLSISVKLLD
jgi:hypothetical protein